MARNVKDNKSAASGRGGRLAATAAGRTRRLKKTSRRQSGNLEKPDRSANRRPATPVPAEAAGRATRPRTTRSHTAFLRLPLPALRHPAGLGLGGIVAVVEGTGIGWDQAVVVAHRLTALPRRRKTGRIAGSPNPEQTSSRAARALLRTGRMEELARVLGALGSTHRLRILFKLLEGAATYRTLLVSSRFPVAARPVDPTEAARSV